MWALCTSRFQILTLGNDVMTLCVREVDLSSTYVIVRCRSQERFPNKLSMYFIASSHVDMTPTDSAQTYRSNALLFSKPTDGIEGVDHLHHTN